MKKLFGLAAAGLLLSAGAASAADKVTNLKFTVTVSGTTLSCTLAATQTSDSKRKITNNIIVTGYSSDCQFWGGGTIGQLAEDASNPTSFTNVATISGISNYAGQAGYANLLLLLKLNSKGQFKDGNTYTVYGYAPGSSSTEQYLGKGQYQVVP